MNSTELSKRRLKLIEDIDNAIKKEKRLKMELESVCNLRANLDREFFLTELVSSKTDLFISRGAAERVSDLLYYGDDYVVIKWDRHFACNLFPLVPQSHYSKGGQI